MTGTQARKATSPFTFTMNKILLLLLLLLSDTRMVPVASCPLFFDKAPQTQKRN